MNSLPKVTNQNIDTYFSTHTFSPEQYFQIAKNVDISKLKKLSNKNEIEIVLVQKYIFEVVSCYEQFRIRKEAMKMLSQLSIQVDVDKESEPFSDENKRIVVGVKLYFNDEKISEGSCFTSIS